MVEPEQTEDEAFPRSVSMTWGEVCDVEVRELKSIIVECRHNQSSRETKEKQNHLSTHQRIICPAYRERSLPETRKRALRGCKSSQTFARTEEEIPAVVAVCVTFTFNNNLER